jgi:hypothetical protein
MSFDASSFAMSRGFDPVTEARLLTHGCDYETLPYGIRVIKNLSDQATGQMPPPRWVQEALAARLAGKVNTELSARRLTVIEDCYKRYEKGIPMSLNRLHDAQMDWAKKNHELRQQMPLNLIDGKGEVNLEILESCLPLGDRNCWPRGTSGELLVDKSVLKQLDSEWSTLLLSAKELQRDRLLNHFCIDSDGRHRTWANPFGCASGRECTKGASYVYLPKQYRSLIEPNEEYVVCLIDYEQQEPAILSVFSGNDELVNAFEKGDLYSYIHRLGPWDGLSRKQLKRLAISFIYGIQTQTIATKWDVSLKTAELWVKELEVIFSSSLEWLDTYADKAYQSGRMESLDWEMRVFSSTPQLRVRNWPIQAAGADILRRACIKLAEAKIDVVGCLHDAVMIEVPIDQHEYLISTAQKIMQDASASVLSGVRLNTKIEQLFWPKDVKPAKGVNHE